MPFGVPTARSALRSGCALPDVAPEVHIYKGEGHVLRPEAQNTHYLRVVDFFGRALTDGSL